jgi:hypothetical protein
MNEKSMIQWNALTPVERNQIIAEKVVGWKAEPCGGRFAPADYSNSGAMCCIRCGATSRRNEPMQHNPSVPPDYSESMDAAWQIVEHFRGRSIDVHVASAPFLYDALCRERRIRGSSFQASAESAAEAICIAALRASGEEVE